MLPDPRHLDPENFAPPWTWSSRKRRVLGLDIAWELRICRGFPQLWVNEHVTNVSYSFIGLEYEYWNKAKIILIILGPLSFRLAFFKKDA